MTILCFLLFALSNTLCPLPLANECVIHDVQIQLNHRSALQKHLRNPLVSAAVANSPELHDVETLESSFVPTLLQAFKTLQLASATMREALEESLPSMHGVLSKIGVVDRASLNMILGSKLQDSQKVATFLNGIRPGPRMSALLRVSPQMAGS